MGSRKPGFAGLDFAAYVDRIDDVAGDLDLVVIDGRAREACLDRALPRLAPGGLVVLDNVERSATATPSPGTPTCTSCGPAVARPRCRTPPGRR